MSSVTPGKDSDILVKLRDQEKTRTYCSNCGRIADILLKLRDYGRGGIAKTTRLGGGWDEDRNTDRDGFLKVKCVWIFIEYYAKYFSITPRQLLAPHSQMCKASSAVTFHS